MNGRIPMTAAIRWNQTGSAQRARWLHDADFSLGMAIKLSTLAWNQLSPFTQDKMRAVIVAAPVAEAAS